jgi:hypothetical protein
MVPVCLDRLDERLEAGVANVVVADAELLERARRRNERGERLAARLAELAVAEIERRDVLEALRAVGEHRLAEHGHNVERGRFGAVEQLDVLVVGEAGEKRDGVGGVARDQRARLRRPGAGARRQRQRAAAATGAGAGVGAAAAATGAGRAAGVRSGSWRRRDRLLLTAAAAAGAVSATTAAETASAAGLAAAKAFLRSEERKRALLARWCRSQLGMVPKLRRTTSDQPSMA